jgi:hypothetical protein
MAGTDSQHPVNGGQLAIGVSQVAAGQRQAPPCGVIGWPVAHHPLEEGPRRAGVAAAERVGGHARNLAKINGWEAGQALASSAWLPRTPYTVLTEVIKARPLDSRSPGGDSPPRHDEF